jgi:hypothetical protein
MMIFRSPKGLRTLGINIERGLLKYIPSGFRTRSDAFLRDLCTRLVTRFKVLPLENVTVVVEKETYSTLDDEAYWPLIERVGWAEAKGA